MPKPKPEPFSLLKLWHFPSKGLGKGRRETQSVAGGPSSVTVIDSEKGEFFPQTELIFSNLTPNLVPILIKASISEMSLLEVMQFVWTGV